MAQWVETLHGVGECKAVLERLVTLTGAVSAQLLRFAPGRETPRAVASVDQEAGRLYARGQVGSVARLLFGPQLQSVRAGAVVSSRDADGAPGGGHGDEIEAALLRDGLSEALIIVLGTREGTCDIIELHYRAKPKDHDRVLLVMLAPSLARTWGSRRPGFVTSLLMLPRLRSVGGADPDPAAEDLLSIENPAGLTRSEYRICKLLRDGVAPAQIADTLGIRQATLKSHLGSIFAKTGCDGQVVLVQRLMQAGLSASGDARSAGAR